MTLHVCIDKNSVKQVILICSSPVQPGGTKTIITTCVQGRIQGEIMNKGQFIDKMHEKSGLTVKDAEKAYKAFTETVIEALKEGEKVQLVGFGTFDIGERSAREGRNPQTGESIQIAASKTPKFKAGKAFKDAINE